MKLFIINGYAGSGKDTFVDFVKQAVSYNVVVANIHSSDRAKEALKLMNWSGAKTRESRRLLADLCDFGQARGVSKELIDAAESSGADVVFFHERNPEQIEYLKMSFPKSKSIWVESSVADKNAEADRWDMELFEYDITIVNEGSLEDLKRIAEELVKYKIEEEIS